MCFVRRRVAAGDVVLWYCVYRCPLVQITSASFSLRSATSQRGRPSLGFDDLRPPLFKDDARSDKQSLQRRAVEGWDEVVLRHRLRCRRGPRSPYDGHGGSTSVCLDLYL